MSWAALAMGMLALPTLAQPAPMVAVDAGGRGETYGLDKAWNDRIEHGASECNRDYAMTPLCVSYKGFASVWYNMANDPNPTVASPAFAIANLNDLGTKGEVTDPPYYRSPQFRDSLRRLLNVTFSSSRTKWGTRDRFADYAYKICMDGHSF
jgi:hypothetical protein